MRPVVFGHKGSIHVGLSKNLDLQNRTTVVENHRGPVKAVRRVLKVVLVFDAIFARWGSGSDALRWFESSRGVGGARNIAMAWCEP